MKTFIKWMIFHIGALLLLVSCGGGGSTSTSNVYIPETVDLGLPSGTLWADCNVGATKPEEVGYLFSYGETKPKETYTKENYSLYKSVNDAEGYSKGMKLNYMPQDITGTEYDAVTANYGKHWYTPRPKDWDELFRECEWKGTVKNGVLGIKITGKNGNSIFVPAYERGRSIGLSDNEVFFVMYRTSINTCYTGVNGKATNMCRKLKTERNAVESKTRPFYREEEGTCLPYFEDELYVGRPVRAVYDALGADKDDPNLSEDVY